MAQVKQGIERHCLGNMKLLGDGRNFEVLKRVGQTFFLSYFLIKQTYFLSVFEISNS